jgi:hypothetical protein
MKMDIKKEDFGNTVLAQDRIYRTSLSSGYHSCFVFERSRIRISVMRTAIVIEGVLRFAQSFSEIAVIVLQMDNQLFFHVTSNL